MASGGQSLKESNEGSKDSKALLSDVNTLYGDIITDSSEDELDIFEPIPYMFVLKDALGYPIRLSTSQIQNAKVICPPFHLLLDHLVAVLWIFYSRNGIEKLSTSHIHWALKFLEGIQTRHVLCKKKKKKISFNTFYLKLEIHNSMDNHLRVNQIEYFLS